ncbi:MAG: phosphatidylglycerol lysyltransferase domain-containing protein, partial [Candidatus Latescibacterota bacterium]
DGAGHVHAYADWLPVYARRGWVIDLMRRREDAMAGVMDFLIGTSLMAFKERGYQMASLSTAPLAGLDSGETSLVQWILRRIYERSHTYYDFGSLFRYKEKFQPHWEHIYLMHRGLATLPTAAVALTRAYLPGFGLSDATKLLGGSTAKLLFPKE